MSYKASIVTDNMFKCYICGTSEKLEIHHIFNGCNRKKSTNYGLVVPLCGKCHRNGINAVHRNKNIDLQLKQIGQSVFEHNYPEEDFIKIFRKNYRW